VSYNQRLKDLARSAPTTTPAAQRPPAVIPQPYYAFASGATATSTDEDLQISGSTLTVHDIGWGARTGTTADIYFILKLGGIEVWRVVAPAKINIAGSHHFQDPPIYGRPGDSLTLEVKVLGGTTPQWLFWVRGSIYPAGYREFQRQTLPQ